MNSTSRGRNRSLSIRQTYYWLVAHKLIEHDPATYRDLIADWAKAVRS